MFQSGGGESCLEVAMILVDGDVSSRLKWTVERRWRASTVRKNSINYWIMLMAPPKYQQS